MAATILSIRIVRGDTIYIADQRSGLHILRLAVDGGGHIRPREYLLAKNYPNPFNSSTTIEITAPARPPRSTFSTSPAGK